MPIVEDLILRADEARSAVPIIAVGIPEWDKTARRLTPAERAWAKSQRFAGELGRHVICPAPDGRVNKVFYGTGNGGDADAFTPGKLSRLLPLGDYTLTDGFPQSRLAALGWLLEAYFFERYRANSTEAARLICPEGVERAELLRAAKATYLVRDLINTPASDMGPEELERAARELAAEGKAHIRVILGKALEQGFPMIHAVGKASSRAPRLIDFSWGPARAPKVTLVGKGVCFDTGGLDIKPASNMLLMKKDMGGAATVLGLAQMIIDARLSVRLRVLVPAVENAISGNAFRPGDVLNSRKGLTVEIGNTDAEGRLVLADALALADEEAPDLLIDMATLTGAARVALGPDLPPFYTDSEPLAADLARHAIEENDPLWRMPFWEAYRSLFESRIADLNNSSESGLAGSITAALFLKSFVSKAKTYAHLDVFGWTPGAQPGRPKGGEAQGMRALFALIKERYGSRA